MDILLARTTADITAALEAGDTVDSKHPVTGESALLLAAQRCDVEAARLLVQSGADPVGSGALHKALALQDLAMTRALLHSLPVFDQLYYLLQLVCSCVLTWIAATLRRWPLYGLPSEVLVAHSMPACADNTLFFCFPDEFGHLKQGIALAKRALQRGYAVDFMCPERARDKLPEGVRWIPMAGSVQRNTDLRVPLITCASRRDEPRMEMMAYVLTDAATKRDNWATYLSGATYLQHRAAQYRCAVLEHVFCAREYGGLALQQNTPVLSLDVTGFVVRPHYDETETKPPRGWRAGGWLEGGAHPLLGWRRWLGGKCRQRQDAAWAQAVRAARLSTSAPRRRRRPTEMVGLHTQPEALLPPGFAQHTPCQHSVGPMLDPPAGGAGHPAVEWIDAAARPVVYIAFGSQLTLLNKDFRLVERLAEAVAASADFCFVWAVPAAAHAHVHPRVAGLGHVHLATWAPQLRILQHPKVIALPTYLYRSILASIHFDDLVISIHPSTHPPIHPPIYPSITHISTHPSSPRSSSSSRTAVATRSARRSLRRARWWWCHSTRTSTSGPSGSAPLASACSSTNSALPRETSTAPLPP